MRESREGPGVNFGMRGISKQKASRFEAQRETRNRGEGKKSAHFAGDQKRKVGAAFATIAATILFGSVDQ